MNTKTESISSPKRLARIAGIFYLLVGITGGFAEGFVDPKTYVAGNAAATAGNVLANVQLVRMSVVSHLVDAVFFVLTAMALYILLLLDIQHYGTLAAQVFFGLWLAPLGYLAYKSGLFPKSLGVTLVAATVCYLVHLITAFLVPDFHTQIHPFIVIVPTIAEIWMVLYLLVVGVKTVKSDKRILAAATA